MVITMAKLRMAHASRLGQNQILYSKNPMVFFNGGKIVFHLPARTKIDIVNITFSLSFFFLLAPLLFTS